MDNLLIIRGMLGFFIGWLIAKSIRISDIEFFLLIVLGTLFIIFC